jgi:hypothetical protein
MSIWQSIEIMATVWMLLGSGEHLDPHSHSQASNIQGDIVAKNLSFYAPYFVEREELRPKGCFGQPASRDITMSLPPSRQCGLTAVNTL